SNASATEAGETDAAQKKSELEGNSSAADTTRAGVEHDEKFLRLAADFENYKRQAARRETEGRERAARSVIEDLLPVLDNFERAVDAARNAKDVESVRIGVEFIAQQFRDALKNHGVEPIDSKGQMFDPLRHDALEEVSGSDLPEGTVIDEAQRGYVYKGTVLRPSRVRVAGK
ncbi:MAG TPA: nucleotide exchange factor GrpE, partial [Abditibacteriaceae bacterium]